MFIPNNTVVFFIKKNQIKNILNFTEKYNYFSYIFIITNY